MGLRLQLKVWLGTSWHGAGFSPNASQVGMIRQKFVVIPTTIPNAESQPQRQFFRLVPQGQRFKKTGSHSWMITADRVGAFGISTMHGL